MLSSGLTGLVEEGAYCSNKRLFRLCDYKKQYGGLKDGDIALTEPFKPLYTGPSRREHFPRYNVQDTQSITTFIPSEFIFYTF